MLTAGQEKVTFQNMIKPAILIRIVLPALLCGIIALVWGLNVPRIIQVRVLERIEEITGFYPAAETTEFKGNMIMMRNVRLDEGGIDTLDSLGIIFSPLSYIGFVKINSVRLDTPALTRGFALPSADALSALNKWLVKANALSNIETLEIRNAAFDIVTPDLGAIRLRIEGLIRTEDTHESNKSFQFDLRSAQKNFAIDAKIAGRIEQGQSWESEITLDKLSLDVKHINILRSSGVLRAGGTINNTYFAMGEADIGALDLFGYPVKEVAAGLEMTNESAAWTLGGVALSNEEIEIGVSYNSAENDLVHGSIYASDLEKLAIFLWPPQRTGSDEQQQPPEVYKNADILAHFKDCFFTYAIRAEDILKPQKSIRITAESFDIAPLSAAFGKQIESANGDTRIQFIVQLDEHGYRTTKGVIYSGEPVSLAFTRQGRRTIFGREHEKAMERENAYNSIRIDVSGDILSDEALWSVKPEPQNAESGSGVFEIKKSLAPLSNHIFQ